MSRRSFAGFIEELPIERNGSSFVLRLSDRLNMQIPPQLTKDRRTVPSIVKNARTERVGCYGDIILKHEKGFYTYLYLPFLKYYPDASRRAYETTIEILNRYAAQTIFTVASRDDELGTRIAEAAVVTVRGPFPLRIEWRAKFPTGNFDHALDIIYPNGDVERIRGEEEIERAKEEDETLISESPEEGKYGESKRP